MISPKSSQAASTCSMAAMSAIEQPAAKSGRMTVTRWPSRAARFSGRFARMSAVSAMKWTPQNTIARQSPLSAASRLSWKLSPRRSLCAITSSCW